ncbi:MAG TPA: MlaD family protein [Thermoleophilaceae bacterium]|nr:MlaD family protein [Thermoleophilaceae bacterium]
MRRQRGMAPELAGLLALLVVVVATWFAFAREVPFRSHYEVEAVFPTANNVKKRQPVRIAGVDVGKVVGVRHLEEGTSAAVVTMRIQDTGRPVHRDATVAIRPRLFLEGNWFLDLEPGTPAAGEIPDGGTIPLTQTRTPVQLGQVLTALQSDTRRNLQVLLDEYSQALEGEGADGFRRSIPHWETAYRGSALVQRATLGSAPHDLSRYVESAGRVARGLDADPEALKSLITDFNTAAGAFARESGALERTIAELPRTLAAARPALEELNRSLPAFRRFARDLEPSVRESGRTVDVAFPFLRQARRLVSPSELRGLAGELRPAAPRLARLTSRTPALYEELRAAASCENEVLHEWSNDRIPDERFPPGGRVFEEAPKPLPGLAGESRNGDANGQWVHVLNSAGDRTVNAGNGLFAQPYLPILGTNPPKPTTRPPFRPEVPCETQEPPDLRTIPGPGEAQIAQGLPDTPEARRRFERAKRRSNEWVEDMLELQGLDDFWKVADR